MYIWSLKWVVRTSDYRTDLSAELSAGIVCTELSAGLCVHLQAEQDWTLLSWRPGGHTALHGASHRHTQDPLQALSSVQPSLCLNMEDGTWCKHSGIIYSCFFYNETTYKNAIQIFTGGLLSESSCCWLSVEYLRYKRPLLLCAWHHGAMSEHPLNIRCYWLCFRGNCTRSGVYIELIGCLFAAESCTCLQLWAITPNNTASHCQWD